MLRGAEGTDAIAGNLDLLLDDRIGIIRRLDQIPIRPGDPDFSHVEAHLSDTRTLGGQACQTIAGASAVDGGVAMHDAAAIALAAYTAALYDRDALPLASYASSEFVCVKPSDFALFSTSQYALAGFPYVPTDDDARLRWASTIDLTSGETVHVPAALVFHPFAYYRRGGDLPIAPPNSAGLACAEGMTEATIAGLSDVVRQDAAALFWQAMTAPPHVKQESLTPPLREMIKRFEFGGDRVFVLDVTSDNTVPAFVTLLESNRRDQPAFVFDAGADLDPEVALAKAFSRLAGTRRCSATAMRDLVPATPPNEWEDMVDPVDHLVVAADHDNRAYYEFATASDVRRDFGEYESRRGGSAAGDLETLLQLVSTTGHHAYAANLTSEDIAAFGIDVCRVLVPGYLPLYARHGLRALGGDRLYEAPQRLGYRGIDIGNPGNPAPHPFSC